VVRAGIDLAGATTDESSLNLLKNIDVYIQKLEDNVEVKQLFHEQILVVKARLHNVRGENNKAEKIIENHVGLRPSAVLEDNLDKVKVLHELNMREEALTMLDQIRQQISGDSLNSQVVQKYVEQEAEQRKKIHFTAKQLND
jgi:hypothetical protein